MIGCQLITAELPIYEFGLGARVEHDVEACRLEYTTDFENVVGHGLFKFIAVSKAIGKQMEDDRIVVDYTTTPFEMVMTRSSLIRCVNESDTHSFLKTSGPS